MANGTPLCRHRAFGGELRAAIGVGRARRVAFAHHTLCGGTGLGPDRGDEHEARDAGIVRRYGERGGGTMIDAVVALLGDAGSGMGDPGEMDDGVDARQQPGPIDARIEVAVADDGDTPRKRWSAVGDICPVGGPADRGVHFVAFARRAPPPPRGRQSRTRR